MDWGKNKEARKKRKAQKEARATKQREQFAKEDMETMQTMKTGGMVNPNMSKLESDVKKAYRMNTINRKSPKGY